MPLAVPHALAPTTGREAAAEQDAVHLTVAYFVPSVIGTALATIIYAAAVWPGPDPARLVAWCLLPQLSLAMLASLVVPHRRLVHQWGARRWATLLCVGYAALGASWGLAFWLIPPGTSPEYHGLLTVAFATAVSAGGVLNFAGFRRFAAANFVPMWSLAALFLVTHDRPALAAGALLFLAVLLGYNHLAHRVHARSSRFRYDAATLAMDLRASEAEARAVVHHAAEAIWHLDGTTWFVLDANPAATALAANLGHPGLDGTLVAPLTDAIPDLARQLTPGSTESGREITARRADGTTAHLLVSTAWIEGPPARMTVLARDISDRKRLEARLRHEATHDHLTGLLNRAGALPFLRTHLDSGRRPAVLFIDLDQFKAINDQFGHPGGDEVLRTAADRLHRVCPEGTVAARLGGDEFLVLLPHVGGDATVRQLTASILTALEAPFDLNGENCRLSATVGVTIADPDDPVDEVELISRADLAMFQGKVDGRGSTVIYDHALRRRLEERIRLEHDLRHALDHDEFEAWGQPVVALESGRLAAVELLARWFRDGQVTMPDQFIPVAEETGMVVELGRQMLGWAVDLLERWSDTPLRDVKVTVNIAARHLRDGQLVADLESRLRDSPIDRSLLVIELTESQLIENPDRSIPYLASLRALGCGLAIDDFGTGYSSLSALVDLPATVIKIDRSFVAGLLSSRRQQAVVEAVVSIGREFDHQVVAEGIETVEQWELLRALGVPLGQGFIFSAALPLDHLEMWAHNALGPLAALMRVRT